MRNAWQCTIIRMMMQSMRKCKTAYYACAQISSLGGGGSSHVQSRGKWDTTGINFFWAHRPNTSNKRWYLETLYLFLGIVVVIILWFYYNLWSPLLKGTYQWQITHGIHDDTLILGGVLSYPAQPRLGHVVPVQEQLLCVWLQPNLTL